MLYNSSPGREVNVASSTSVGISRIHLLLLLVVAGAFLPVIYMVSHWQLDANGFSPNLSKLPEWDFTNLWFGGRLALSGSVSDLFDVNAYRSALRAAYGEQLADHEWSYPPSMLLIGSTLSALPLRQAYFLWTAATLGLLSLILWKAKLSLIVVLAALVSPGALINIIFGHNGALTAALLIGGLLFSKSRPILAGVLLGLLTIKPHLGVLVPFCLLASCNWRAIIAAVTTAVVLFTASGLIYGFEAWVGFWNVTRPLMTAILEAPFPSGFQKHGVTVFLFSRSLGANLLIAYIAQGVCALIAAALVWRLWRQPTMDPLLRVAITVILTFLATPYAYSYDMVAFSVAVIILISANGQKAEPVYALAWIWPGLVALVFDEFLPISPIVVGLTAWVGFRAGAIPRTPVRIQPPKVTGAPLG